MKNRIWEKESRIRPLWSIRKMYLSVKGWQHHHMFTKRRNKLTKKGKRTKADRRNKLTKKGKRTKVDMTELNEIWSPKRLKSAKLKYFVTSTTAKTTSSRSMLI